MLINLLILVIVIGVVFWILQIMPIAQPWKNIALVIAAVIVLVYLLRMLGVAVP
jgi:hypothetical protein